MLSPPEGMQNVLRPQVVPDAATISDSSLLMYNNAISRTASRERKMLQTKAIRCVEWPVYSSDLNKIEHFGNTHK